MDLWRAAEEPCSVINDASKCLGHQDGSIFSLADQANRFAERNVNIELAIEWAHLCGD